jgi:UDP-N-acetylmuramyl pentapeptide phosphotransferase/UDP-N-acetylglucosamine-1-phosphate transferase
MGAILLGLSTLIVSYFSVVAIRRWAEYHQVLDFPNERSSHTRPTARGGGLAIIVVSVLSMLLYVAANPEQSQPGMGAYVIGAALIAIVSWIDDLRSVPAYVRLSMHGLGALFAIAGFGYWQFVAVPVWGMLDLQWLGLALAWLWIVGLINAFNFMDGIDGLAGGQAVLTGLGWTGLGWLYGQTLIAAVGLIVAASSLGFLWHNWPPARIFMGDVGSTFLGYTFAVLSLMAARSSPLFLVAGVLLVWPFVFDASFTILRRMRHHENIVAAHRTHLYQRLVTSGSSHLSVTVLYLGLSLAGIVAALLWLMDYAWVNLIWLCGLALLGVALWQLVIYRERRSKMAITFAPVIGESRER